MYKRTQYAYIAWMDSLGLNSYGFFHEWAQQNQHRFSKKSDSVAALSEHELSPDSANDSLVTPDKSDDAKPTTSLKRKRNDNDELGVQEQLSLARNAGLDATDPTALETSAAQTAPASTPKKMFKQNSRKFARDKKKG